MTTGSEHVVGPRNAHVVTHQNCRLNTEHSPSILVRQLLGNTLWTVLNSLGTGSRQCGRVFASELLDNICTTCIVISQHKQIFNHTIVLVKTCDVLSEKFYINLHLF